MIKLTEIIKKCWISNQEIAKEYNCREEFISRLLNEKHKTKKETISKLHSVVLRIARIKHATIYIEINDLINNDIELFTI